MKKKATKAQKENSERWVLTYADVMNLLLIFFIILFAISQVNQAKAEQLSQSLNKAFGSSGYNRSIIPFPDDNGDSLIIEPLYPTYPGVDESQDKTEAEQMDEVTNSLETMIAQQSLQDKIDVSLQERGIKISVKAQYLFASGSAVLNKEVMSEILEIGEILKLIPGNMIQVEGYTDTEPINSPFYSSNWELASVRATNVLRVLVEKSGIPADKICAVSYGEFHPIYPNDTPDNKAKNRRVDIIVLKQAFSNGENVVK